MKIALSAYNLHYKHSGQARFLVNMAKGLKILNQEVSVYSLNIDDEIKSIFDRQNIIYYSMDLSNTILTKLFVLNNSFKLAKKLAYLIKKNDYSDFYITLADESLPVIKFIKAQGKKYIYLSQGDLSLLYFNKLYIYKYGLLWKLLSRSMVKHIWSNSELAHMYDMVLGNSKFTSNIMSFVYNMPFSGFVYPPVDDSFKQSGYKEDEKYMLAILRNSNEPSYPYIKKLSRKIKIKIIGGATVDNCENYGFISEKKLIDLYSGAEAVLSLNPQEFYGYSIAESLSCGTPVLSFDAAGAQELIKDGYNGWLVPDEKVMHEKVISIMKGGYDVQMRENALKSSKNYTIESSAQKLLYYLKGINHYDK